MTEARYCGRRSSDGDASEPRRRGVNEMNRGRSNNGWQDNLLRRAATLCFRGLRRSDRPVGDPDVSVA